MGKINIFFFAVLFFFTLTQPNLNAKNNFDTGGPYKTPKSVKSINVSKAAVSCGHPLAAQVGLEIIKQGGNAIDASIAVQFALAVVYPRAGNIGGGGFLVYRSGDGKLVNTLDFRERAASAASRDMYLDEKGNVVAERSQRGALAAGVPGTVDGCYQMFLKYSKLKNWKKLIQPAVNLAYNGFTITELEAKRLNDARATFVKFSTINNAALIKPEKQVWKEGNVLIQKDLAYVLKDIRDKNVAGFYAGKTAKLIVEEMQRGKGLITLEDLKNYKSVWRKPMLGTYRGYGIISMPPPSSGGIALMQLLTLSEKFSLKDKPFHSSESVHFIVEAERRVFADRATHLGDADFYKVPVKGLLDKNYIIQRFSDFDANKATPSKMVKAGELAQVSEQTTHISIVDAQGNAAAVTTTLNDNYGCRTIVGGAGFILNNEMDDFSAKPGVPNLYGAIGGEANSIKPLKRPLSSMSPTIVTKDGKLFMVVGTPGGTTIMTSVFQVITNVIDYNMSATEATQSPRFHSQWMPDVIMIEKGGLPETSILELKQKGHAFVERTSIGLVETILVKPNGTLEAVADKRSDDDVEGY